MQDKWKVKEVDLKDIIPTEVNANSMDEKTFNLLVDNIKKTGLSSMIACYESEGKYHIISGNHRFQAIQRLGWKSMKILYTEKENLTNDEIIALQLSHNSVHGSDNKSILKRLIDEITSIDFKEMTGIKLDELESVNLLKTSIIPISEHYTVSFVLYREDMNVLKELFGIIDEEQKKSDIVFVANGTDTKDKAIDIISEVRKKYGIKSTSISFAKVLQLAKEKMDETENS